MNLQPAVRWWVDVLIGVVSTVVLLLIFAINDARADTWLDISGLSYHFDRSVKHNEHNTGLGFETDTGYANLRIIGGFYKNSFWRESVYVGVMYTPWHIGDLRLGVLAGPITGYGPYPIPVVVPTASYEWKHIGFNVGVVPKVQDKPGVAAIQFKVKW